MSVASVGKVLQMVLTRRPDVGTMWGGSTYGEHLERERERERQRDRQRETEREGNVYCLEKSLNIVLHVINIMTQYNVDWVETIV